MAIDTNPGTIWASSGGQQEGITVVPIYESVPLAASRDMVLYQALALVDAVRLGKPRELAIARASLKSLLSGRPSER